MRCWEHDDLPRNREHTLAVFDDLHQRFPDFKVTMFGIPVEMTEPDFTEVAKRSDWMRLAVHGFYHDKAECREPTCWQQYMPMLDELAKDARWRKLFKAPWHGLNPDLVLELNARGFAVSIKTLPFFPYPMWGGVRCSCLHDHWYASGGDNTAWVESHPIYDNPRYFKAMESALTEDNLSKMTAGWSGTDTFVYSEDLIRPLCLKVNIGCGPQVWDGWECLDNRPLDPRIKVWDMRRCRMPYGNNKADAIVMSHALAHLPAEQFGRFFADVFRVLRPGAVFRFLESDCASGYIWRRIGEHARGNGPIVSEPTKAQVIEAMRKVGFAVVEAKPGVTLSPHKDILRVDGRLRRWRLGQTFGLEGVKAVAIPDITRASHRRPSTPRSLRHVYERGEL